MVLLGAVELKRKRALLARSSQTKKVKLERIQAHAEIIFQRQMTRLFRLKLMQTQPNGFGSRLGHFTYTKYDFSGLCTHSTMRPTTLGHRFSPFMIRLLRKESCNAQRTTELIRVREL